MQQTSTPQTTGGIETTQAKQQVDIASILTRPLTQSGKVRVVNGANERYFDNLVGRKVSQIRKRLRDTFNIANDAEAYVNGEKVSEDSELVENATLEFIKEAGTKGVYITPRSDLIGYKELNMTSYQTTAEILGMERGEMPPELQDLVLCIRASITGATDSMRTDELIQVKKALEYRVSVWTPSQYVIDACIFSMCHEGILLAEQELTKRMK